MELKDILAKVACGNALSDDERAFVACYDPQAALDTAAAAARKRADVDARKAREDLARLQEAYDELKAASDPDKAKADTERLMHRIEKLEAARNAAEARTAALERTARVRSLAKEAGLVPARGVDPKTLDLLVDGLTAGLDLDDADAVKEAFDGFKAANGALIASGGIGGAGQRGASAGAFAQTVGNPFDQKSPNLTEQMRLAKERPDEAARLAQEAGVRLNFNPAV